MPSQTLKNEQNYKISINLKKTTEAMPYIHCYVVLIIMATKTEIKNEMNDWYGFELTDQQVDEFLNEHPEAIHFDTVERETFADYIAKKITGMLFPMNGDSQEYKQKFYAEMKENSKPMGYIWNLD